MIWLALGVWLGLGMLFGASQAKELLLLAGALCGIMLVITLWWEGDL